jgi:hypothetical protein
MRLVRLLASVTVAVLTAAAAPALVFGAIIHSVAGAVFAFVIALPHAVLLGLPLFALLHAKGRVNAMSSIVGGFVVGITPTALLFLVAVFNANAADWRSFLFALLMFGGCGAVGGLGFLAVWKVFGEPFRRAGAERST